MPRLSAIVLIAAVLFAPGLAPTPSVYAQNINLEPVRLQLKWRHQFQFAGYYAALEKGYYREAGLQVTIKEAFPGLDLTDELISGRADYLVNNPSALLARAKGKGIVALAAIFQHSPLVMISLKESEIHAPTDLLGRKVMFIPESESQLVAMFVNEGVSLQGMNIVPHSWDISDLINNNVDALGAYLTDAPFLMEKQGVAYNLLRPITYGIDFYGDVLFTSQTEIDKHPDRVKAFREATINGWHYAMNHQAEIVDLIIAQYPTRLSRDALLFEAEKMQDLILPDLVEMGHMNPGRWRHISDTYKQLGLLPVDFSLEGFLYEPNRQIDHTEILVVAFVLGSGLVIAAVFIALLRRMVRRRTEDLRIANKELAEQRNQMAAIINGTTDAIFIKDAAGKYVVINDEVVRLFGKPREEIIGYDDTHFFSTEDAKFLMDLDRAILKNGKVAGNEEKITTLDGQRVYLSIKGPIIDDAGSRVGLFGVSRDITERKQTAEELVRYRDQLQTLVEEQTRELKNAHSELLQRERLSTLGRITATVSHELRNPLGTIQTALCSIENCLKENRPDQASRALELAERGINRCVNIIEDLNGYARVKTLMINEVLLADWLEAIFEEQPVPEDIIVELDCPRDIVVQFDQEKLRQVMVNLVSNAVHALCDDQSKGNHLRIAARLLDGIFEIRICDDGIGMTREVLDKVFEPLFSTKGFGVGLGMVIVKNIVEQHRGEIRVESTPGEGTVVVVRLPVRQPA